MMYANYKNKIKKAAKSCVSFIGRRKIFFFTLGPVVIILLFPFYYMLYNNYRLWVFSSQLNVVDEMIDEAASRHLLPPSRYVLMASGSKIKPNSGSARYCVFIATKLYRIHADKNREELRDKIAIFNFSGVSGSFKDKPDKFIVVSGSYMIVTIQDRAGSGLDVRC